ncbi:hypothetical protein FORC066_0537 [Yersinia enterocolitica]|nr:hypothetical protein FORC066_0537 [Yersinia enterocolitica]
MPGFFFLTIQALLKTNIHAPLAAMSVKNLNFAQKTPI